MLGNGIDPLVKQYYRPLFCFVSYKLNSCIEAEDIVQETWMRSLSAIHAGSVMNIRAYLYCVARHLIYDHFRTQPSKFSLDDKDLGLDLFDHRIDPERNVIAQERTRQLDRAVAQLPPRQKTVFLLLALEGLSCAQVGRRLGISRQTAHEHMTRAVRTVHRMAGEDAIRKPAGLHAR
jgi:RNA polymerase sigma factor (sigma-70 family)